MVQDFVQVLHWDKSTRPVFLHGKCNNRTFLVKLDYRLLIVLFQLKVKALTIDPGRQFQETLLMEGKYAHELPIPFENPLKKRVVWSRCRTLEALGEPH